MKRTLIKNLAVMMAAVVILGSVPPAQPTMAAELTVSAVEAAGSYQHDPMKNPKAAADIVENLDAVYGYSPSPESKRLKEYVDYDWTDETVVNQMREQREAYHASMQELYDMIDSMKAEGKGIEEIARAVSTRRNEIRLEAYKDDPEGLEKVKQSNLDTYGNENGGTPDYFYEKYGSWETVLEKALSVNAGADACLGLYDKYYDTYLIEETDPEQEELKTIDVYDDAENKKINELTVGYGETEKIRIEPNDGAVLADDYPEIAFYKDADRKIPYEDVDNRIRCIVQQKKITDDRQLPVYFITGKKPSETAEENSFYMHIKSGNAETMLPVTVKDTTLQTPLLSVTGVTDKNLSIKLSMPATVTYESLTSGDDYWWEEPIETLYYHVVARNTVSENQEPYYDRFLLLNDSDSGKALTYGAVIPLDEAADDTREVTVSATFCRTVDLLFDEEKSQNINGFRQNSETVTSEIVLKDHAQPSSMKLQNVKKYLYDYQDEYDDDGAYTKVVQIVYNGGDILATDANTSCTCDNPNIALSVLNGELRAKYKGTMTTSSEKATVTVTPKGAVASKSFSLTVAHAISEMSFADRQQKEYGEGDITLYKKEGKALTYTLTPVFQSDGPDPYDKKPAVTYYTDYSNDSLKSYICFDRKTGKITVKADYKAKSGDKISVTGKASDRNGEVQCSGQVTVYFTSEAPEEAGRLALITSTDKGATYTIITDAKTPVTKTVLLGKYTKLVMLNKDAPANGTVRAETLFENYVITDPHYELAVPSDVTLERGYLNGFSEQTDQFNERNVFQFGKTLKVTATEMRTQKKYTLNLKTEENVLPADAEVDHLEYIGPDGTVVKSDDDDTLTFYDPGSQYPISVVFKDSDGNYYPSLIKDAVYGFSFKNAKDLKLTDQHQIGIYVVSMKNEAVDKKQKGTFKVSFKTAKTSGSGLQTKTSREFTVINDPEDLDDPDFTDVNKEKLYAKTAGQSKTLVASYTSYDAVLATLPAGYYDSKGKVSSAYKDAETLMNQINDLDGVTYSKGTLTFDKSIRLTGTKPFTIYLTQGKLSDDGDFIPKTRKGAWKVTPQAIGKFTPAKQYKIKVSSPEIDLAKPGAQATGGKNYDTNTVIDAGVYNVVTNGKENSFNSLFRVVNGTTLTITNDAKVIEKFVKAYASNSKDAEKEWLTGYVQLTTNTYNPKNVYLTKVTVSFDGKLSNLTP